MTSQRFAAIVLAAGSSSRMGRFKPLLSLGKQTVIERVVDLFRSCAIQPILVVVGHQSQEMFPLLERQEALPVKNPDFRQGMYSSIIAGVSRLPRGIDAFFIMPGDIPLVQPATLQILMAEWKKHPEKILRPAYQGRFGHPPLLPFSLADTLLDYDGSLGLRGLLKQLQHRVLKVEVPDRNILIDMNRPEDFEAILKKVPGIGC